MTRWVKLSRRLKQTDYSCSAQHQDATADDEKGKPEDRRSGRCWWHATDWASQAGAADREPEDGRTGGRCWWRATDWKAGRPVAGEVGETRIRRWPGTGDPYPQAQSGRDASREVASRRQPVDWRGSGRATHWRGNRVSARGNCRARDPRVGTGDYRGTVRWTRMQTATYGGLAARGEW